LPPLLKKSELIIDFVPNEFIVVSCIKFEEGIDAIVVLPVLIA